MLLGYHYYSCDEFGVITKNQHEWVPVPKNLDQRYLLFGNTKPSDFQSEGFQFFTCVAIKLTKLMMSNGNGYERNEQSSQSLNMCLWIRCPRSDWYVCHHRNRDIWLDRSIWRDRIRHDSLVDQEKYIEKGHRMPKPMPLDDECQAQNHYYQGRTSCRLNPRFPRFSRKDGRLNINKSYDLIVVLNYSPVSNYPAGQMK